MTLDEAEMICDKAAADAGEYFDTVLVIGSWTEEKDTHCVFAKSGNWFTCLGMAHDFLQEGKNDDLADKIAGAIAHKEGWDEGDDEAV